VTQLPDRGQRLLNLQRGVIASWQADQAGIAPSRMRSLVRSGRWQQLHFGVYATFTGKPPRDAMMWAALLRAGAQSILSHETAGEVSGLLGQPRQVAPRNRPRIQALATDRRDSHPQIVAGGRSAPSRGASAAHPGGGTVLDLAQEAASFDDVVALLARSCQRSLTTPFLLSESLNLRAKSRWRRAIDLALRDVADGVQSVLEFRYLWDVERAHGLPAAKRQTTGTQQGRTIYRDVRYRGYAVVVELDGKASHPDDQRWRDKYPDNAAAVGGFFTLRYGWADVTERPCETATQVGALLGQQGWPGALRRCGPTCRATRP
jgi:hypothetical protein